MFTAEQLMEEFKKTFENPASTEMFQYLKKLIIQRNELMITISLMHKMAHRQNGLDQNGVCLMWQQIEQKFCTSDADRKLIDSRAEKDIVRIDAFMAKVQNLMGGETPAQADDVIFPFTSNATNTKH